MKNALSLSPSAVLFYTGHGEENTGNWCFKDGVITFDEIFGLYMDIMRGKPLLVVSDCSHAGKWVEYSCKKLDEIGISSCGHHTREQGILMKVYTACSKKQRASMGIFSKRIHSVTEKMADESIWYPGGTYESDLVAVGADFIEIRCHRKHGERCQLQGDYKWLDRTLLGGLLYCVRGKDKGKPAWHYVLVDEEKEEAFKEKVKTGSVDVADYGEVIKSGWGEDPPESVKNMMSKRFGRYLPEL